MSPPDVASPVPMQAIVDLLERKAPEQLARLREAYPLAAAQLAGGKRLGDAQAPAAPLLSALADAAVAQARQEAQAVVRTITSRQRRFALLRMIGALVSSLATGGLLAAVLGNARQAMLVGAVVAFVASALTAAQQFMEEHAGGAQSLRERLDAALKSAMVATEAEGELRLMQVRNDFADLDALIRKLNAAVATTRQIELALG